jgi:hypothetical protein
MLMHMLLDILENMTEVQTHMPARTPDGSM